MSSENGPKTQDISTLIARVDMAVVTHEVAVKHLKATDEALSERIQENIKLITEQLADSEKQPIYLEPLHPNSPRVTTSFDPQDNQIHVFMGKENWKTLHEPKYWMRYGSKIASVLRGIIDARTS